MTTLYMGATWLRQEIGPTPNDTRYDTTSTDH